MLPQECKNIGLPRCAIIIGDLRGDIERYSQTEDKSDVGFCVLDFEKVEWIDRATKKAERIVTVTPRLEDKIEHFAYMAHVYLIYLAQTFQAVRRCEPRPKLAFAFEFEI